MWLSIITFLLGAAFGAFVLDRYVRVKHGKKYDKWISDDFEMQWRFIRDITVAHNLPPFSKTIQSISPQFVTLFGEALVAERAPLNEIAGLGYVKALEVLIKDLAIRENPDKRDAIETTPLATCVKTYVNDELLKNSAELATWLRNDQVHYKRRYEDKGIRELKLLIRLVVQLIEESERRKGFASAVETLRNNLNDRGKPSAG